MIAINRFIFVCFFTLTASILTNCEDNRVYNMEDITVKEIDIKRFMGHWHQVARFCDGSKKNLEAVTMEVSMDPKGILHLFVTGHKFTPYGPVREFRGKGKWNENRPGIVRSTFFLNFYKDYNILYVDEAYSVVLISNQPGTRLHILSRHPSLSAAEVTSIRNKIRSLGYDPAKLCWLKTHF
jgi:apolipoprotein D and lipocalin family protein